MATPVDQLQVPPELLQADPSILFEPEPPQDSDVVFDVADLLLTEEEEEELVKDTLSKVDKGHEARKPLEDDWRIWRLQYENRLTREDTSDDWESDIDIPITFERSTAIVARIVNPIVQEDPIYTAKPRPTMGLDQNAIFAAQLEPYMDWTVEDWKMTSFCEQALIHSHIFPFSVVKVPFIKQTRTIQEWVRKLDPMTGQIQQVLEPREYVIREGAIPEVCNPETVCWWPLRSPSVDAAEMVWHTVFMAPHEVKAEVRRGFFKDRLSKLKLVDRGASDTAPGNDPDAKMANLGPTHYEIVEVYRSWEKRSEAEAQDGSLVEQSEVYEIILWIDRESKTLLRAIHNPFADYQRPFFFYAWEERLNELIGRSLCQRLEDIHRAISASFNQRLEAGALANATSWATDDDDFADAYEDRKIRPGEITRLTSMPREHLMEMKLSQPFSQLPELESMLEMHADKAMGTNAYTFGIEQIERPTATGQTKLMQEGQMPLFGKLRRFRDFLAEIMYAVLSRHKQMYPNGSRYWVRDEGGNLQERVMEFPLGPIDMRVVIEIKASEAAWDKNAQKQDAIALVDRLKDSYTVLGGMIQQAAMPSPSAPAMLKMALGFAEALRRLLKTFEVPQVDALVPDFSQEVLGGQLLFQQITQLQGQLQTLVAGLGGVPGGPGNALPPGQGGQGPA